MRAALAISVAAAAAVLPGLARAGTVWFVRAGATPGGDGHSFASALPSLDAALSAAGPGDEVRVARGTYVPSVPGGRASTFTLRPGVSLYGGFSGDSDLFWSRDPASYPTILSGDRLGDDQPGWEYRTDNCYRVLTAADPAIGAATVVEGFTITGGNADGMVLAGGGLFISDCQPTVRSCTFIENVAGSSSLVGRGGAVSVECPGTPRLVRFESCRFESNIANLGGALSVTGAGASGALVRCVFLSNVAAEGGGARAQGTLQIADCRFLSNTAVTGNGGGVFCGGPSGRASAVNSVFAANVAAGSGGAIALDCCVAGAISNCTLTANYASQRTGGVRVLAAGATLTITNSIVAGNAATLGGEEEAQVGAAPGAGAPAINWSLVSGWSGALGGVGNISGDPLLKDPAGPDGVPGTLDDDDRLSPGSPCIDAGAAAGLPADELDIDADGNTAEALPLDLEGSPRSMDGDFDSDIRPDMGAFEYHCASDFDRNAFVNGADFDAFVIAFEAGGASADFDGNGFVNGADFDGFVIAFEAGC